MSGGAISTLDWSQAITPSQRAQGLKQAIETTGFIFIKNHGMQQIAKQVFEISQNMFMNETEDEKARCAYKDNKGWTGVGHET